MRASQISRGEHISIYHVTIQVAHSPSLRAQHSFLGRRSFDIRFDSKTVEAPTRLFAQHLEMVARSIDMNLALLDGIGVRVHMSGVSARLRDGQGISVRGRRSSSQHSTHLQVMNHRGVHLDLNRMSISKDLFDRSIEHF